MREKYLVGCDGGRSVVRKQAGIEFAGWDPSISYMIAEVEMSKVPEYGIRRADRGVYALGKHEDGKRVGAERHPVGARLLRNDMAQTALDRSDDRALALHDTLSELPRMEEPHKRYAAMMSVGGPHPARRCAIHGSVGAAGVRRGHGSDCGVNSSRRTRRVGGRGHGRGPS